MNSATERAGARGTDPTALGPLRRGRLGRYLLVSVVALIVLVAGYATYGYLATQSHGTVLTIYTYPSFLGGGCGQNASTVFAGFERAHDVSLRFLCPAGTLAGTLIAEKSAPVADLVVGLDEVTTPQAEAAGVLVPYAPPALASVSPSLASELSPDHAATPYEWGYLGFDACGPFANATLPARQPSFPGFAANSTLAGNLIVEDPTSDITGEEFLLWEIAFYTEVLHAPWAPWWSAVAPHVTTADSWGTAFSAFTCAPSAPQMVVSYLTDPAYAAAYGAPGSIASSGSWWNGTEYGWRSVYGAAIVRGSPHLGLDEAFLQALLAGPVQAGLPTEEWEYPANATVPLPPVYQDAPNVSGIVALNGAIPPSSVAAQLPGWIDTWQATVNSAG